MKQHQEVPRTFALTIIALIIVCLLIIIFSQKAQAQYRYPKHVVKDQKERSFQEWEKNQPRIRVKAVKSAVKQSKEMKGNRSQSARLIRKENRIRKSIIK
jgi:hypothetical protein